MPRDARRVHCDVPISVEEMSALVVDLTFSSVLVIVLVVSPGVYYAGQPRVPILLARWPSGGGRVCLAICPLAHQRAQLQHAF